jgi:hypothetical protein
MNEKGNAGSPRNPKDAALQWRRHRRFVRLGQALMLSGLLVALTHWLAHLEAFGPGQPPGWMDLASGYPTATVLLLAGAILAGRRPPTTR